MTTMVRAAAWLLPALLAIGAPALSGCLSCEPLLEARHFMAAPDDVDARPWTEADGKAWPDVEGLMRATETGEHAHQEWTDAREQAFWDHFGVPDGPEKELWFGLDGEVYRVRVLNCGGTT